jgi:hypothetical protein
MIDSNYFIPVLCRAELSNDNRTQMGIKGKEIGTGPSITGTGTSTVQSRVGMNTVSLRALKIHTVR